MAVAVTKCFFQRSESQLCHSLAGQSGASFVAQYSPMWHGDSTVMKTQECEVHSTGAGKGICTDVLSSVSHTGTEFGEETQLSHPAGCVVMFSTHTHAGRHAGMSWACASGGPPTRGPSHCPLLSLRRGQRCGVFLPGHVLQCGQHLGLLVPLPLLPCEPPAHKSLRKGRTHTWRWGGGRV